MKRTTLSLVVAVAVLALIVGAATLTRPSSSHATESAPPQQVPVQRAEAVCPQVRGGQGGTTVYSGFAPENAAVSGGTAVLTEVADAAKTRGTIEAPGRPGGAEATEAEVPALDWEATDAFAPGFAAQVTTKVPLGAARGLSGTLCREPDTEHWFVGTSTAQNRDAYLYLSNNTRVAAQIDVELYGPDGEVQTEGVHSMTFAPGESQNILLKTLKPDLPVAAVHVLARSGRIAADVRDQQGTAGTDWLPEAGRPGRSFVVPGVPEDVTNARLVLVGTSDTDTEVGIEVAGKASTFKPAGFESVNVGRGKVVEVDLGAVTKGEASAIKLTAARADILAGVRVTRGTGDATDVAYLAPTPELTGRAILADNRAGGALSTTVYLTAPAEDGRVRLTTTDGAAPATAEIDVPGGTTVAVQAPVPPNAAKFALIAEPIPGSAPVHAARMINEQADKTPMFTIQGLTPAHETVALPGVRGDIAIMVPTKD
ncbi:DUF5719 family protein [Yinghuangia sp. ASG 101]|uniref:DUF5719 family protein n=1 Tax=Yinghuangia sp. ASG 101 TaxID=2896848 RepID=UPI001E44CB05|nr:DUF5719 family protein [Yinghuangia sp. ASG 101]UGQ09539.1 DUF5719 family protein [Yinghuangia sp. ASG 101]